MIAVQILAVVAVLAFLRLLFPLPPRRTPFDELSDPPPPPPPPMPGQGAR